MARTYADVNASLGRSWYDYGQFRTLLDRDVSTPNRVRTENFDIEWSSPERYELIDRIGGGRYSEVSPGPRVGTQ